jgi:nucleoside-diphosphate-sugar epimerase
VTDERALEDTLSRPEAADVTAAGQLQGDLVVLGVSGKMGPSLARLARRAADEAGVRRRIIGVARFTDPGARLALEQAGIETLACDLADRAAAQKLPDAPNVVYMAGQKFGTTGDEPGTWATNVLAAVVAAERYRGSRLVAFSTGNVYPLTPVSGAGPRESDPTGPIGEYAQSALGRERILTFLARRHGTPLAILRLNYAIEPRYGVLRDIAERVRRGEPMDLAMGHVNVIWQRDANAIALRCLSHCAVPPFVLNVTGPAVPVREIASRFGARFGVAPVLRGRESETALLSDAARCREMFGPPVMTLDAMIAAVADWMDAGGRSLGKLTHFDEREGSF